MAPVRPVTVSSGAVTVPVNVGAPTSGTFDVGDFIVDQSGHIWVCTVAGTPGTWTNVTGSASGYQLFTSSGTFNIPAGVTTLYVRCVGGGSGGSGGTVAASSSATGSGGGGGAAGMVNSGFIVISGDTALTITVGAGGAAATWGNTSGAGGNSQVVGASSSTVYAAAAGGSSAYESGDGVWGAAGENVHGYGLLNSSISLPGSGGASNGWRTAVPILGVAGGAGGVTSTTTLGGGAGQTATGQLAGALLTAVPPYAATTSGISATAPTVPGCGGGGGGGAAYGGTAGAGSAGSSGQVELWW